MDIMIMIHYMTMALVLYAVLYNKEEGDDSKWC